MKMEMRGRNGLAQKFRSVPLRQSGLNFQVEEKGVLMSAPRKKKNNGIRKKEIESAVTEDQEEMKGCLKKVMQMGFRIAIDDFGTGYSSLNMLYEIPAQVIKIDKSFTEKATLQGRGEFMRSMRQLIRAAKEEVVVEGIETEEQCEFLKNCGFEYGQGFLFDRPIPVGEFEKKYL